MQSRAKFVENAATLLGKRGFTQDVDLIEPWLTDWRGRYSGKALALASPANTREVAALVKLCSEADVPIVPQGGNSGMSGGATPDASGASLLLSLRRLNTIEPIDIDSQRVTCGAGVVLQTLHDAAASEGLRFPLTLGGKGSATIGGLVSTNAGGTQVLRHGTMRAQVLGLQAVMADGQVFDSLTPLKKDNRGFDLKQLMIGSGERWELLPPPPCGYFLPLHAAVSCLPGWKASLMRANCWFMQSGKYPMCWRALKSCRGTRFNPCSPIIPTPAIH